MAKRRNFKIYKRIGWHKPDNARSYHYFGIMLPEGGYISCCHKYEIDSEKAEAISDYTNTPKRGEACWTCYCADLRATFNYD